MPEPKISTSLSPPKLDGKLQRISTGLSKVSPGSVSLFLDACNLMQMDPRLESATHFVSHALREIESSIRQVSKPPSYEPPLACAECGSLKEAHTAEIAAILTSYGLTADDELWKLWKKVKRLQRLAHRDNLSHTRRVNDTFLEYWETVLTWLDLLLDTYQSHFQRSLKLVDSLLSESNPNSNSLDTLRNKIPNTSATLHYFFRQLENPLWLPLLDSAHYFNASIEPYPDEFGTYDPLWSATFYLQKLVKLEEQKAKVAKIVLKIQTSNQGIQNQLIEIATTILPQYSSEFTRKFIEWVKTTSKWHRDDALFLFIKRLFEEGNYKDGLSLFSELFKILPDPRKSEDLDLESPEPTSLIHKHDYDEQIKELTPILVNGCGINGVEILADLLNKTLILSRKKGSKEDEQDYLELWRSQIEIDEERTRRGHDNTLITALRDSCHQLAESDKTSHEDILKILTAKKWITFRRLAYYFLFIKYDCLKLEAKKVIFDKGIWENYRRLHEYELLIKKVFPDLNQEEQLKIYSWIDEGPDKDELARLVQTSVGKTEEIAIQEQIRIWKYRELDKIHDILDETHRKDFEAMKVEFGEIKRPKRSEGVWVGPTSDKTAEELSKMKADDVVEYLKSWEPSTEDMFSSSPEGLGRELSASMKLGKADRFSLVLEDFKGLHPTYTRSLLQGYREALGVGQKISWELVLPLCDWIISQEDESLQVISGFPFGEDPNWSWARNTVLDLIQEGFGADRVGIPFNLRTQVWKIIEALTHDPNPSNEDEKHQAAHDKDYYSIAINSIRSKAIDAVCEYAIWVNKPFPKDKKMLPVQRVPEAKRVLEDHLKVEIDPSLAIHSVYGFRTVTLRWMDSAWFESIRPIIYPKDKETFRSAWDAYVSFSNIDKISVTSLANEFKEAITFLAVEEKDEGRHHEHMKDMTIEHLMLYLWHGEMSYEDSDGLIKLFFSTARPEYRARAIEKLGFYIKDLNGKPDATVVKRLKDLLEKRIIEALQSANKAEYLEELVGFGTWFTFGEFDRTWLLHQLKKLLEFTNKIDIDHMVFEKLVTFIETDLAKVLECATYLVIGADKQWQIDSWSREILIILSASSSSTDQKIIHLEEVLRSRLMARGYSQFNKK